MKRIALIPLLAVALAAPSAAAQADVFAPAPVLVAHAHDRGGHAHAPIKWQRGGHAKAPVLSSAARLFKALVLARQESGRMSYSQSGSRGYLPMNTVPPATDCSGFVTWALRMAGANVPLSTSYSFMGQGRAVPISQRYLQPGDIVIYSGHVEVYWGHGLTYGHGSPGLHVHQWNYRPVLSVRRVLR